MDPATTKNVLLRVASPEFDELRVLVFRRYPQHEWATFARFGWRATEDALILTLAAVDAPGPGDLDEEVGHVAIREPYSLRTALAAEKHPLAVGVIHSHPRNAAPRPSSIDDDMDSYYADYFEGFAPARPYVSLVMSEIDGELAVSGRVFWHDEWLQVGRIAAERTPLQAWVAGRRPSSGHFERRERTARLSAAFGDEAEQRLRRSTVAVVGAGGTGSAAIEVLARAGVGRLIIADPDRMEFSNLERVHGSVPKDASERKYKALVAQEHVHAIDPSIVVEAYAGALPQERIIDAMVQADVALGCTDQQHSRLALSDLAVRYLLPALDCGVMLEGSGGAVTGQIAQLVRLLPGDACVLCRGMIAPTQLAQELMPEEERAQRQAAAAEAQRRGEGAAGYWQDVPQLNTVGYLTTIVGAMVAGYAIGWLTGRFEPPFRRLQANLVALFLDVTDVNEPPRPDCACRRLRGWADQGAVDALITAPSHWPNVQQVP